MKESEMLKILAIIKTAYPRFDDFRDPQRLKETNKLWYRHFKNFDYAIIEKAVDQHISKSSFPPSIAEIREIASKIVDPFKDAVGAWTEVKRAISNFGFYQAYEALQSMSDLTVKTVRQLGGWGSICMAMDEIKLMNQFNKVYDQLKAEEIEAIVTAGNYTIKLEEGKDHARTALPSGS